MTKGIKSNSNKAVKVKSLDAFGSYDKFDNFALEWQVACCRLNRRSRNWKDLLGGK